MKNLHLTAGHVQTWSSAKGILVCSGNGRAQDPEGVQALFQHLKLKDDSRKSTWVKVRNALLCLCRLLQLPLTSP